MNVKKTLASLAAASLCFASVPFSETTSQGAEEPYRIMCVGDSITHGYINDNNGYRKYLCYYLQQNGIAFDMVGPNNSWSDSSTYDWNGTEITYDPQHAGYSGYSIMNYSGRTGIYETMFETTYSTDSASGNMMEAYAPDVILLQIGTNDLLDARLDAGSGRGDITEITTAMERLETLVDKILEHMDDSDVLFVTSVPDIDAMTRSDWLSAYNWVYGVDTYNDLDGLAAKVQECVDAYNAGVAALVAEKQAEGKNVQLGDIHSCIDIAAGDLEDGVHPSEQGYAKMGAHWAERLTAYLNGGDIVPPAPTETTEQTSDTQEDNFKMGDVNFDGEVTVTDAIALTKHLLAVTPLPNERLALADLHQDGAVNGFDLAILKRQILMYTPRPW